MPSETPASLPVNPVLAVFERNGVYETVHRGAWVLVELDRAGNSEVLDGLGDPHQGIFARSAMKGLQALPVVESGAASEFGLTDHHLALACASHSAEPQHLRVLHEVLAAGKFVEEDLGCGPSPAWNDRPNGPRRRAFHCCSGKHAAMLVTARHHDVDPARYLDPDSPVQQAVRQAVSEMVGTELFDAIDGCSAPTFRMPLGALATGIARLCSPATLAPSRAAACDQITAAVGRNPELIGGATNRSDTDLIRATDGRLFAKLGAEGVYVVGERGTGKALAINVDDGNERGFHALCLEVLDRHEMISAGELASLERWANRTVRNAAGTPTGQITTGSS